MLDLRPGDFIQLQEEHTMRALVFGGVAGFALGQMSSPNW
jgi:hypothetical protein